MRLNKKITLLAFFLLGVVTLSFVLLAFSSSNVQLTSPGAGSFGYLGKQGIALGPQFNEEMCNTGQDFVIQIPPFGCTPAVVRSDLLEEQNVPVLCQLSATKINPLIEVEAIDSLSFRGDYPEGIEGIGFHPARAAVRSTQRNLLNSPILQNIGYAVIVLKQQKNEASMPDVISGNVTARIRYDIKNAFGIGKATQYLPEFTEDEWRENFKQYGFWDGRAFLRAEVIDTNHATISMYADEENKISTVTLERGKTSRDIHLPGFSCLAGLQLRLDGLKNPDTRVRLNINGEIVQVADEGRFLENKCSVKNIEKRGLVEETTIVCSTNEGGEKFDLVISPKIKLTVGDEDPKPVGLGDFLYKGSDGKFVYVGYIGTKGNNKNLENLFVYLFSMPTKVDKLSDSELLSISRMITRLRGGLEPGEASRITNIKAVNSVLAGAKAYVGIANYLAAYLGSGKDIHLIDLGKEESVLGKGVKVIGFAEPVNREFTDINFKTNFENAMRDYRRVIESFPNEEQRSDDQLTFGQRAFIDAMSLSFEAQQKRTLLNLCKEFTEKYPDDGKLVGKFCEDRAKHSSEGIAEHSVFVNGRVKSISLEGIYEPSISEFSAEVLVTNESGIVGRAVLTKGVQISLNENEFLQLEDLDVDSAKIRMNLVSSGTFDAFKKQFVPDTGVLELNKPTGFRSNYVFTLEKVNLEKVAQVSVLPNIRDSGTETNFSFNIGIEKRGIQLSPEKTKERIENLNESIAKWEDRSEDLGKVVRGFNAACLAVGTTLTVKNLIDDFDGRAIARQEVMRSDNGWYDICKKKVNNEEFGSVDSCLLSNSDQIDRDVDFVEDIINDQEGITNKNNGTKLLEIKKLLKNRADDPDVSAALTEEGFNNGKVTLTQARDIERLASILNSGPSSELRLLTEKKLDLILGNIKQNSQNFARLQQAKKDLEAKGISGTFTYRSYQREGQREETYDGLTAPSGGIGSGIGEGKPFQPISFDHVEYLVLLESIGNNGFRVENVYDTDGNSIDSEKNEEIKKAYSSFRKRDTTTYNNQFKDPKVRFFETEPYKGLPALVPFDTANGWYVAAKQTLPGAGALRDSSIRAYDDSGAINSFYLCNVGPNGKEEFNSPSNRDDTCRSFNPGFGGIRGEFPGLGKSETSQKVSQAIQAIEQASRQYTSGLSGTIRILNENIGVGEPEIGLPDIQCQDFMSPSDCHLLFNTCDPVVCPSSRCDFGGSYPVSDVIQSGIIGSTLLCLPNAQEEIYVPICLTGVKAGIDSFVSVQENYRDCLQTNLETGETVGICDELHSIYLCDFFWSQTLPLSQVLVPKALEYVTGQTGRGGGEYLGVVSAWKNAGDSVDYITNYYGANSFEAFKTGVVKEVGNAFCKSFISASYPDVDFLDSVLEPESPPQYTAWFSERSFSTATVPAISQYKVFYHIFAGENEGAYFNVFLKNPSGTSFFQTNPTLNVDNGFIPEGDFASETKDFTAVSGYRELCINVNGQEECGFNRVSTDFGLDYLQDQYLKEQGSQTNIQTENECISGTPSLYSLVNPNLQAGLEAAADPSLYREQIVRICSTDNPERGTDPRAGTADARWVEVGTCDSGVGNLKCYLDRESVKKAIQFTSIENETLKTIEDDYLPRLKAEGNFIQDLKKVLEDIEKLNDVTKVNFIDQDLLDRAFFGYEKATLILTRADAYSKLALAAIAERLKEKVDSEIEKKSGTVNSDDYFDFEDEKNDVGDQREGLEKSESDKLNDAISQLDVLINKYPNPATIFYDNGYSDFDNLLDQFNSEGVFINEEYEVYKQGTVVYNLPNLKLFLEDKKNQLIEGAEIGLKASNDCIESAEWTDKSFNTINTEEIGPGRIFIKLDIKSIDACGGYSLAVYNPEIFGSDKEFMIDSEDIRKLESGYFLFYDVDVIKNNFIDYDPNKYKFKIYDSKKSEIFVGKTLVVDTIYAF